MILGKNLYQININNDDMLFDIIAYGSLLGGLCKKDRNPIQSVIFYVYKKHGDILVTWCDGMSDRNFVNFLCSYYPIPQKDKSIQELISEEGFVKVFKQKLSYKTVQLTEEQKALIMKLYNEEFDETVNKPHGLDGFDYYITKYKNGKCEEHECWCTIPREWTTFQQVAKLLSEIGDFIL